MNSLLAWKTCFKTVEWRGSEQPQTSITWAEKFWKEYNIYPTLTYTHEDNCNYSDRVKKINKDSQPEMDYASRMMNWCIKTVSKHMLLKSRSENRCINSSMRFFLFFFLSQLKIKKIPTDRKEQGRFRVGVRKRFFTRELWAWNRLPKAVGLTQTRCVHSHWWFMTDRSTQYAHTEMQIWEVLWAIWDSGCKGNTPSLGLSFCSLDKGTSLSLWKMRTVVLVAAADGEQKNSWTLHSLKGLCSA